MLTKKWTLPDHFINLNGQSGQFYNFLKNYNNFFLFALN